MDEALNRNSEVSIPDEQGIEKLLAPLCW